MFSSVVESQFLRLKLSPYAIILNPTEPESPSYDEGKGTGITDGDGDNNGNDCKPIGNQNIDFGGWSFVQSLSSRKGSTGQTEIYVHPLAKSYACNLSGKSLDMCTESLGSETGSDSSDDILFLSSEAAGCDIPKRRENSVTRGMSCCSSFPPPLTSISGSAVSYNPMNTRRMSRGGSFPPPLTSISGSNGVRVTSHREGGRLVLQAVSDPTCHTYMHAERSEGRLRLCLLKEGTPTTPISDYQDGEEVVDDDDEGVVNEEQSEGRLSLCHSKITTVTTPIFDDEDGEHEEQEREEVAEEDEVVNEENGVVEYEVEKDKCHRGDEGMNVKSGNIGGKLEMGKLARPMSCKERRRRHKGFLALEPYLVAT
ncbi:hypothetical protein HRI_000605700 [Hibiscus trionum]|uniref:FAF domain-containing protein n=1 Tax=Hibiscus trionum TaxID=183268 RepID=A0A9W7LM17_HIBTR|nr:hypothetical protein HRI_000605700 [Hibiscus trionum]